MKKVGVITFHNAHNYGAMLQTYALQESISKLGCEPYVINYNNDRIDRQYNNKKLFLRLLKKPVKNLKKIISFIFFIKKNVIREKKFNNFSVNNFNLTKYYPSEIELKKDFPKLDFYITGSDQVWNTDIVGDLEDAYTLNFGNDRIKRISYAASIGNSEIESKFLDKFKNKLKEIDNISVREYDAEEQLKKILLDKNISVVLDPTLLLEKDEWNNNFSSISKVKEKYILAYVVEENAEYRNIVNYLSNLTGLKVIHFEKRNRYENILLNCYTADPFEFVNLIKNAEFVITTSFHATVFSIIFEKKFYVVPHEKTGSRVSSLLNKLELTNRMYYSLNDFKKANYNEDIDYVKTKTILEKEIDKSMEFLKKSLDI